MLCAAVVGFIAAWPESQAQAEIIQVTMQGQITTFDLPIGLLPDPWGGIELGDSFLHVFTYDSLMPDTNPHAQQGSYIGAILGGSVTVGDVTAATSGGNIEIRNDMFTNPTDWQTTTVMTAGGQRVLTQLYDPSGSVFGDDSLPTFLDLGSFPTGNSRRFEIGTQGNVWVGQIASLSYQVIPGPGVLTAIFAGALMTGRRRAND